MGNWGNNPTYRGYFTPFITGLLAHLVDIAPQSSNILQSYLGFGSL